MHCFLRNRTTNFKNFKLNNRYGAPLFRKNALRKGEKTSLNPVWKKVNLKKSLENRNFMLIN